MKYARRIFQVASLLVLALTAFFLWGFVAFSLDWNRFHAAKDRQLSTLWSLRDVRPPDWTENEWENVIPYNVWGNAVYAFSEPRSSDLDTMWRLETELNAILDSVTAETSIDCIDRVYKVLADAMPDNDHHDFVRRNYEAYRETVAAKQNKSAK